MPEELFADSDRFPHDTVDGETVLIDSRSGDLFLFAGVGPVLWQRFMLGATIDDAVATTEQAERQRGRSARERRPGSCPTASGRPAARTW